MSEAPSLIEAADAAGAEPEPEPEPEPEAMEDGEGDDDDDEEGADGDDGGEEMAGPPGLRKSRGNKYAAATSEDAFANLLTGDSQVQARRIARLVDATAEHGAGDFILKQDGFCTKNDGFCTNNDGILMDF